MNSTKTITARDLQVGDVILDHDHERHTVTSIEPNPIDPQQFEVAVDTDPLPMTLGIDAQVVIASPSSPYLVADMPLGAHVTIPTVASGTHTGVLVARRPLGAHAPAGQFMATIQYDDGTQQEVRTSDRYTGWVNGDPATALVTIPSAALRPGHVIGGAGPAQALVRRVRAAEADGVTLVDVIHTRSGDEYTGIAVAPTVRVVVYG